MHEYIADPAGDHDAAAMAVHPAAQLLPAMANDEFDALVADIREHGLRAPIVTLNGAILDGRSRFAACRAAAVEPRFEEWEGEGSPVAFVLSANVHRRHLTASHRAAVAAEAAPLFEAEAKARQRATQFGSQGTVPPDWEEPPDPKATGEAVALAAEAVGASRTSAAKAKRVLKADPSLHEEVKAGRMTVSSAEDILRARLDVPRRQVRRPWNLNLARVYTGLRVVMDAKVTAQQILEGDSGETVDDWLVLARDMRNLADELVEGLQNRNISPTTEEPAPSTVTPAAARVDEFSTPTRVQACFDRLDGAKAEARLVKEATANGEPMPPTPNLDALPANRTTTAAVTNQ